MLQSHPRYKIIYNHKFKGQYRSTKHFLQRTENKATDPTKKKIHPRDIDYSEMQTNMKFLPAVTMLGLSRVPSR